MNTYSPHEKALRKAKERLLAMGVHYPFVDLKKSPIENYEAIQRYSELEAKYYHEYLKQPSGPRPLEINNTQGNKHSFAKPYKEWVD